MNDFQPRLIHVCMHNAYNNNNNNHINCYYYHKALITLSMSEIR